jgi:hypothetical protein
LCREDAEKLLEPQFRIKEEGCKQLRLCRNEERRAYSLLGQVVASAASRSFSGQQLLFKLAYIQYGDLAFLLSDISVHKKAFDWNAFSVLDEYLPGLPPELQDLEDVDHDGDDTHVPDHVVDFYD